MATELIDGRYQVKNPLAEGTSGRVFHAVDTIEGRSIALKILHPRAAGNSEFVARFRRECRLLEEMNHPNAVRVFATGVTAEKQPYVAMELVEGRTFSDMVAEHGPLEPRFVGQCLEQMARVLDFAHEKGIVHRDLKPGNIMVADNGEAEPTVKVLDFGIAKLLTNEQPDSAVVTAAGIAMGTPQYMSPEQAMGKQVSPASDIYAIGVVLYSVLTGRLPFDAKNDLQTMLAHVKSPVPRFSEKNPQNQASPAVEAVVRWALAKDPAMRPQSAGQLASVFLEAVDSPEGFFDRYPELTIRDQSAGHSLLPTSVSNSPTTRTSGQQIIGTVMESMKSPQWTNIVAVVAIIGSIILAVILLRNS